MASWSGKVGPVRALVQGNLLTGTAHGGTLGIPTGAFPDREYDIFTGAVVAYAEVDSGLCDRLSALSMAPGMGTRATASYAAS